MSQVQQRLVLGRRLPENPLITARDVTPSHPGLEVVSVFNAAAARIGNEIVLVLRVAERPRSDIDPPPDALTLDLDRSHPVPKELSGRYKKEDVVGMAFLDFRSEPPEVVAAYIPRDLPGLDLRDPRTIRHRHTTGTLLRASDSSDYLAQMSHLRVARSRDGVHFSIDRAPALAPQTDLEEYGVEDPRVTLIGGTYYMTYVSVSRWGITTSLATTTDFRTFVRRGVIFLPDHKDVVIFPEKVNGQYVALTRPMPGSFGRVLGVWIASSPDLVDWGGHRPVCLPRRTRWDELRTGASCVPFRVKEGWLELYHGVDRADRYSMGAVLLDGDDPRRVLARSPWPILEPETAYEQMGLFNDTVFACGHVPLDDGRIRMYYGCADSVIAAADFDVHEIVASLEPWTTPA